MRFFKFGFLAIFSLMLISCSKVIGYGVVNWSIPEYNLVAGDVLPIYVRSNVTKAYIVGIGDGDEKREIPLWQLTFFKNKSQVEEFRNKISENAFMYAEVLSDGLPMRSQPENLASQVYRLRENQIVKIFWKGEGVPVLKNGEPLSGEWYWVMTDDGVKGWCFSLNLRIFDEREETPEVANGTEIQTDPILTEIFTKQWYPESYEKMLAINQVDLESISPDYGFFPGLKTNVARINLKDKNLSFSYTNISKGKANIYNFEGSNLSLQVRSENKISVQFTDNQGMPDVEKFVTLSKPLETIIEEENDRRMKIISEIAVASSEFNSVSYGNLQILANGNFTWTGYDVLSGTVIPKTAQNSGQVKIRFFVSPKFSSSYDFVLSFFFEGISDSVDFLANLSSKGLQLEYVEKQNIEDGVVERQSKPAIILFFAK